ncbi:hypothetical protein CNEO4_590048 [Clostridium neonatale]|nr:hypothetical protein CNEO4_400009 [Clostridium neonatale]CAI3678951.1 hypothetical protein CNEO2_410100 [Clostridium neonatale]CAI3700198.1 hypothetical protein CNEO4_590048 [Clostridium neonatale]
MNHIAYSLYFLFRINKNRQLSAILQLLNLILGSSGSILFLLCSSILIHSFPKYILKIINDCIKNILNHKHDEDNSNTNISNVKVITFHVQALAS